MSKGKLIVISGASGVGKGTVLALAMEKRKDLSFSVSATTATVVSVVATLFSAFGSDNNSSSVALTY